MSCENEKLECGVYILYIVISVEQTICLMKEKYGVRYLKNGRVTKNRNFKNERVEVRGRLPLE